MRIPAIFYWPGKISAGKVSVAVGSQLDLMATYAELAGAPLPNRTLDSHSLTPLLFRGESRVSDEVRDTVFFYRGHTLMAVRYKSYKAHYVTRSGWNLDPPETHNPPILYHLGHDPSEAYPLDAGDYKPLLAELDEIVKKHTQSIGTLPKAELDPLDLSGKIAPCCNHDTDCTCSAAAPFPYGPALNKYGSVPYEYQSKQQLF